MKIVISYQLTQEIEVSGDSLRDFASAVDIVDWKIESIDGQVPDARCECCRIPIMPGEDCSVDLDGVYLCADCQGE